MQTIDVYASGVTIPTLPPGRYVVMTRDELDLILKLHNDPPPDDMEGGAVTIIPDPFGPMPPTIVAGIKVERFRVTAR